MTPSKLAKSAKPAGADFVGGDQSIFLTAENTVVREVTITAPAAGVVIVNASGFFDFNDVKGGIGAHGSPQRFAKVAEELKAYANMSPGDLARKIDQVERRMYKHAENLEFEEAANLRDELRQMRDVGLKVVAERG